MAARGDGARGLGTLALTHSSRSTHLERCSHDFLTRRFADPARLADPPPLASLPPAQALYCGALSLWRVTENGRCRPLGAIRHRDKIQHASFAGARELLVGFEHRVERWRLDRPVERLARLTARAYEITDRFEHPWLAGLHTVEPLPGGRLAVACSASDAVLELDERGRLVGEHRMPPELYGSAYTLAPDDDLRRHYIDDELQACHLNAATPIDGGSRLLVSTLIQGAIGVFERAGGGYRELRRGRPGAHGARATASGGLYFTDSAAGALVFLDDSGREEGRFEVGSRWLHDSIELAAPLFAFALADANELRIYNVESGALVDRRRFGRWPINGLFALARRWPGWLGNSTQALSFRPAPGS